MNDIAIQLADVGKRYGFHWVLSHADCSIRRGEAVALFGGNGSGKSTLLKMIATMLTPSTGRLTILGHDVRQSRVMIRRKIRLLAHEKQLYGSLTVYENLRLAASLRGVPMKAIRRMVTDVVEQLQLTAARDRQVMHLSEGMKKRVVLARLLLGSTDPELILLDEPHPTLDVEGRRVLDTLLKQWRAQGKTLLLASHDHDQALGHVDRVIFLRNGRIAYDGAPKPWGELQ